MKNLLNVNEFLEYFLFANVEYDDFYWMKFDNSINEIISNDELKQKFTEEFILKSNFFNKENIGRYITLLNEIIIENEIVIQELYPIILKFMYCEFCYNPSIPHKFVKLMLKLKSEKTVFKDMVDNISKDNVFKTGISIFALYGLKSDFKDLPTDLVNEFFYRVLECLKNNSKDEKLKCIIENYLINEIPSNIYNKYYIKFKTLLEKE